MWAVWDEQNAKWWFNVLDIVAVLTDQNDYTKTRNYWKYLKAKLKKGNNELVSATTQLKLLANDGKRYLTDMLDYTGFIALGKEFPSKKANRFIEWFTYSDESIDGKSKTKANASFEEPEHDSWSAHAAFMGRRVYEWQDSDYVLGYFGIMVGAVPERLIWSSSSKS